MAKKKAARSKPKLSREEQKIFRQLHKALQPKALEMLEDERREVGGEIQHRWKWGRYVDEAFDEKRYGEGQVLLLAEFLGKSPEVLWQFRKFYRAYPTKEKLDRLLVMRRRDGKPLQWAVLREVLRKDFDSRARNAWLQQALSGNWSHRELRKRIAEELRQDATPESLPTPNRVLRGVVREADRVRDGADQFDQTLEQRLINGNAEDFTDEVMQQLETTRASLLELQETVRLHLELVENCLERGRILRREQEEEEQRHATAVTAEEQPTVEPEEVPVRQPRRRRRRRPGSVESRIAAARERAQGEEPATV